MSSLRNIPHVNWEFGKYFEDDHLLDVTVWGKKIANNVAPEQLGGALQQAIVEMLKTFTESTKTHLVKKNTVFLKTSVMGMSIIPQKSGWLRDYVWNLTKFQTWNTDWEYNFAVHTPKPPFKLRGRVAHKGEVQSGPYYVPQYPEWFNKHGALMGVDTPQMMGKIIKRGIRATSRSRKNIMANYQRYVCYDGLALLNYDQDYAKMCCMGALAVITKIVYDYELKDPNYASIVCTYYANEFKNIMGALDVGFGLPKP